MTSPVSAGPSQCPPPPHTQDALRFTSRIALLAEKHCEALTDFNGERGPTIAMDLGCAVGGASFELARSFDSVLGIDYSHAFVEAAQVRGV